MSRVKGHIFTQEEMPCGRLVPLQATIDGSEHIAEFLVPSLSRGGRVYGVELDLKTGELACGCEAFRDYRECSRMPYRRDSAGTFIEHLAVTKGKHLLPLVTRPPRGLCPHTRRVREFIRRHGFLSYFKEREKWLEERLAA